MALQGGEVDAGWEIDDVHVMRFPFRYHAQGKVF